MFHLALMERTWPTCPTCGHKPSDWHEAVQQRTDLAELWLELDTYGHLHERHHCVACQPHDHVQNLECALCGNGPILTGHQADSDLPTTVHGWLVTHGWRPDKGLGWVCGEHR